VPLPARRGLIGRRERELKEIMHRGHGEHLGVATRYPPVEAEILSAVPDPLNRVAARPIVPVRDVLANRIDVRGAARTVCAHAVFDRG